MAATAFTKAQVERAVSGVIAAGVPVGAIEVTKDGTIRILVKAKVEIKTEVDKFFNDEN